MDFGDPSEQERLVRTEGERRVRVQYMYEEFQANGTTAVKSEYCCGDAEL